MTWPSVITRGLGSIELALVIEGVPYALTTAPRDATWAGLGAFTVYNGALLKDSLKWTYGIDYKRGELEMSDLTFQLVDGIDGSNNRFVLSSLFRTVAGTVRTFLTATLSAGGATATVDSTAGFPASGDIFIDQEAMEYTGLAAGPPRFTGLTRGKYLSTAAAHTYDPPDDADNRGDLGLVPVVSNRPTSMYGRRCRLLVAEVDSAGNLTTETTVWRGRIAGSLSLGSDGVTWELPAESLYRAIDTKIMAVSGVAEVRGIQFTQATIDATLRDPDGVNAGTNLTFNFPSATRTYVSPDAACAHFTEQLNAGIVAVAEDERWRVFVDEADGRIKVQKTAGDNSRRELIVKFPDSQAYIRAFFFGPSEDPEDLGGWIHFPLDNGAQSSSGPRAPAAYYVQNDNGTTTLPVSTVTGFSALDVEGAGGAEPRWGLRSVVSLDGKVFRLFSVDGAPNNTLTIQYMGAAFDPLSEEVVARYPGDPPIEVRWGVWLRGDLFSIWKEGFIENTSISDEQKGGLLTGDFDWTDMQDRLLVGDMRRRSRILVSPQSFRDLLLEDLHSAGMAPAISSTGLITARNVGPAHLGQSRTTLDNDDHRAGEMPGLTRSRERIVNQIRFKSAGGDPYQPTWDFASNDINVIVNNRTSQARTGLVHAREIVCRGLRGFTFGELQTHLLGLASSYFAMFGDDFPVVSLPVTARSASLLPGDAIAVTHDTLPDVENGDRGVSAVLMLVTRVAVDPLEAKVDLDALWIADGVRRSGFAPAARINAFVDNGAGAGATRYELQISPLLTYDSANEGLRFLAGMKVELREWDDDSAPTRESLTVSSTPTNATGTVVYVTTAPAANPAVGTWVLTLDEYDTASQTNAAQDYLHVCDEATGLIGASGETGFQPA